MKLTSSGQLNTINLLSVVCFLVITSIYYCLFVIFNQTSNVSSRHQMLGDVVGVNSVEHWTNSVVYREIITVVCLVLLGQNSLAWEKYVRQV